MKEIYASPIENIKESSKIMGNVVKKTFEPSAPYLKRSFQKKVAKVISVFEKKTF